MMVKGAALLTAGQARPLLTIAALLLLAASTLTSTARLSAAPLDISGDVAYSYRALDSEQSGESISHQYRGSLKARTWLWQPWLATVDLGLRGTLDASSRVQNNVSSENTAAIVTGDLNLGILPQSRSPLQLTFRASDSRVEWLTGDNPLTGLGGREYSSQRLAVRQRYFTEDGHRMQAFFDNNNWQSGVDSYTDWQVGTDMSVRLPKQTLTAKASLQNSEYSLLQQKTVTQVINVDHFYYPGRALRVDSMASIYSYDRSSQQPLNSTNQADSQTDLSQLSSTVFWRPEDRPLTISGGVRLYDLAGETTGNSVAVQNMSAMAGMFYQWTKNLRLDASMDFSSSNNDSDQVVASRQRLAALYQSDINALFRGATWQWYSSTAAQLRDAGGDLSGTADLSVGHDAQKTWRPTQKEHWRLSFSQSGASHRLSDNGIGTAVSRVNHSTSLSWDRYGGSGMSMAQLTLSDSRQLSEGGSNQQFFNFQLTRNQTISRLQSLNGNLTLQNVRRDFNGSGNSGTVTTATGQINYNHSRILGVPRLRFVSGLRLSKAASDEFVNRGEWENRLNYAVGLLDLRLSWRHTVVASSDFDLLYFQVSRRF